MLECKRSRSTSRERRMIEPEVREPLWGVEEVSAYLGVPVRTLYQWRTKNYGPTA
ncbi:MAG: hypothetical protein QOG10_4568 [Kribbellaceae bacterium]|nr:hypothetical protein [Kribbellaceae bacterium]